MATTYTVSTGGPTFTHAVTGVKRRFTADTVVSMETAVAYQMPGASLDAAPSVLSTAEEERVTALATTAVNTAIQALAPASLDDLADVTITTPQEDEVLTRSGSGWVNAAVPS